MLAADEMRISAITNFNESEFLYDLAQSKHYYLKAKISTTIPNQQTQGEYGICFEYELSDGSTILKWFSSNRISGNPLRIVLPITHTWYEEQQNITSNDETELTIVGVNAIYLYTANFSYVEEDYVQKYKTLPSNDIFISDLDLEAATKLTGEEITTSHLTLIAPHREFTVGLTEIPVTAELRKGGKVQNLIGGECAYYWYIEQPDVIFDNINVDEATKIGGEGWRYIDKTTTNSFVYTKELCPTNRVNIKCVLVYNTTDEKNQTISLQYDKVITLRNIDYIYNADSFRILQTTDQMNWSESSSHNFIDTAEVIYLTGDMNNTPCTTAWYSRNKVYDYTKINTQIISNKTAIQINGQSINEGGANIYYCCYYVNNAYIGYKTYNCTFGTENQNNKYEISFKNSDIIYYYNEQGVAPTVTPQGSGIQPITYSLIEIEHPDNVIDATQCQTVWMVTANDDDRLIDLTDVERDQYGDPKVMTLNGIDYNYAFGPELSYTLKEKYSVKAHSNQIKIQITYKNDTIYATTQLYCYKVGDPNTQIYGQYCDIIPYYVEPNLPDYTYFNIMYISELPGGGCAYSLNNNDGENHNRLIMRYQDPDTGYLTIAPNPTWATVIDPPSKKEPSEQAPNPQIDILRQLRVINGNQLTGNGNPYYAAGLVKGVYTIDETNTMYSTIIPVGSCTTTRMSLVENSGFTYIKYGSNGNKPIYDDNTPFQILLQNAPETIDDLEIRWIMHNLAWNFANSAWEETKLLQYRNPSYDGVTGILSCKVTVNQNVDIRNYTKDSFYVECQVRDKTNNNELIGIMMLPIDVYIIPNDNTVVNGWDGHSLTMSPEDAERSYLMASMLGAGHKDENNRFTGVVIGDVLNYASDNEADNLNTGIFGYGNGQRTFFVDANTGKTIIGGNSGAITITPGQKKEDNTEYNNVSAEIASASYTKKTLKPRTYKTRTYTINDKEVTVIVYQVAKKDDYDVTEERSNYAQAGYKRFMENGEYYYRPKEIKEGVVFAPIIDFEGSDAGGGLKIGFDASPEIIFGNENFMVDSNGLLTTNNATIRGNLSAGDQQDGDVDVFKAIKESGMGTKEISRVNIKQQGDFSLQTIQGYTTNAQEYIYERQISAEAVSPEEDILFNKKAVTGSQYQLSEVTSQGFKFGHFTCGDNQLVGGIQYSGNKLELKGKVEITDATIFGNFKAGDDTQYTAALNGEGSASKVQVISTGTFSLDTIQNKKVSGSYIGYDEDGNSVVKEISGEDGYKRASVTSNGFSFGTYARDIAVDGINKEDVLLNGISYSNGNLTISGKLVATTGTIGGWTITSRSIKSPGGGLILYSDGRISGYNGNKNGGNQTNDFINYDNRTIEWREVDGSYRRYNPETGQFESVEGDPVSIITSSSGNLQMTSITNDVDVEAGNNNSVKLSSTGNGIMSISGVKKADGSGAGLPTLEMTSAKGTKLAAITGVQETYHGKTVETGIIGIFSTYAADSTEYKVIKIKRADRTVSGMEYDKNHKPIGNYTKTITGKQDIFIYQKQGTVKETGKPNYIFIKNPSSVQINQYIQYFNEDDFNNAFNSETGIFVAKYVNNPKSVYWNQSVIQETRFLPRISKVLGYAPNTVIRSETEILDSDIDDIHEEDPSLEPTHDWTKHIIREHYNTKISEILLGPDYSFPFELEWGIFADEDNEVKALRAPDGHITIFEGFSEL